MEKSVRVLIALTSRADEELISGLLQESKHKLIPITPAETSDKPAESPGLIITDLNHVEYLGKFYFPNGKPEILIPVLLLVPQGFKMDALQCSYYDDIIRIPISKQEFITRLNLFLRLRQQAVDLKNRFDLKYRAIFENTGTATLIVDESRSILMANHESFRTTGYTPEELKGQNWTRFVAPESLAEMIKNHELSRINPDLAPRKYEVKLVNKAGQTRTAMLDVAMIPGTGHSIVSMLDITELRETEKKVSERDEQYKVLFNQNNSVMLLIDPTDGKIIDANEAACSFYGYLYEKLTSMKISDINTLPEERIKLEMSLAKQKGKNRFLFDHRLSNGTIKPVEVYSSPVTLRGKKYLYSIVHDSSERVASERKIKTLIRAIEQSPYATIITDAEGNIEFVNEKFTSFIQYTLSELSGRKPIIFNPGHLRKIDFDNMWATIRSGSQWTGEFLNRKKDGTMFWEEVTISAIHNNDGSISNYILVMADITDKKKAELQIRLLSQSVNQSPVSVMITDKDGNLEYVNPKFEENTGYKAEEILGQNPRFLKSGEHPAEFYKEFWDTILEGKIWKGEFKNKRKNGELYWDESIVSPIHDENNNITQFVAVQQDITEKKKLLDDLKEALEKAQESNRLKTAFLHNISHEIRTPMNAIVGFSHLLGDPATDQESKSMYIEAIQNSANHLLSIITDIVNISSIEAKIIKANNGQVNVNSVIRTLYNQFSVKAKEKGLSFSFKTALNDNDAVINTDGTKLTQIISNLLNNALKFTSEGEITYGYTLEGQFLEFYVSDTGIGIPMEEHVKIFEAFYQVDNKLERLYEGTGLGLAICKAYTGLLGGEIWVESKPDAGSVFRFTLPYKPSHIGLHQSDTLKVPEKTIASTNKTILVAEDEDNSYMYLEILLRKAGYKVIRASDGKEAVDLCRSLKEIDLVLMDVKMPVMDGYEATRQIRQFRPHLPVIAQTAYASDREKAVANGCSGFISKPINPSELHSKISELLKNN